MDERYEPGTAKKSEEETGVPLEPINKKRRGKKRLKLKVLKGAIENNDTQVEEFEGICENDNAQAADSERTSETDDAQVAEFKTSSVISTDGQMSVKPTTLIPATPEKTEPKFEETIDEKTETENLTRTPSVVEERWNKRALKSDAKTYELETFGKHAMLIFNHAKIKGYKDRLGTEFDVSKLKATFGRLGFEVEDKDDLTKDEIMSKMDEFSNKDYTHYGCVAVVILSHGTKNGLIYAKDQVYNEMEILKYFKVHSRPFLVTKPKILIIQACRGTEEMTGVDVMKASTTVRKDSPDLVEPYTLPVEADMLVVHSSYIGKQSHRVEEEGSWFIQSLCDKIDKLSETEDLDSILVEMKRDVAVNKSHADVNRATSKVDINKQMPVTTSTLIRKLYLRRGDDLPPREVVCDFPSPVAATSINTTGDKSVMDSGIPTPPLQDNSRPCPCYLEHFEYMKNCLNQYVKDHSHDDDAENLRILAHTFDSNPAFDEPKYRYLIVISNLLSKKFNDSNYLKYVHFYEGYRTQNF